MRIADLHSFLRDFQQLNEANLINLDQKYNGVSVSAFLDPFMANVGEKDRAAFKKKLAKLIVNDEKYHKPVTKLADNAPEWAHKALEAGQLVQFVPDAALEGAIEHISHYVAALEQDAQGPDGNKSAVANRELAGIPKAENLALLSQKSNEYFVRGSKKTGNSIEGTTHIYDGEAGYSWYRLDTLDAYKREGKVLQNCIGTHWTPTRADRIYAMKNSQGETVVAVRTNENNEIQEVKGKNNRPPVPRYMPAVAELINHMHWKVEGYGMRDLHATGYTFHEGVLYSKSDAIEKFVKTTPIANEGGYTIDELSAQGLDRTAAGFLLGFGYESDHAYSIKQNKMILATVSAHGGSADRLSLSPGVANDVDAVNGPIVTLLRTLFKQKKLTSISGEVRSSLKNAGIAFNQATGSMEPLASMKKVEGHDKVGQMSSVDGDNAKYVGKIIQHWLDTSNQTPEWLDDIKEAHFQPMEGGDYSEGYRDDVRRKLPVQVGVVHQDDTMSFFTVNVDRDSHNVTIDADDFGSRRKGANSWQRNDTDDRSIDAWINLANQKHLDLPATFQITHGVVSNNVGYERLQLSKIKTNSTDHSQTYDVSNYEGVDRLAALMAIAKSAGTDKAKTKSFMASLFYEINSNAKNKYSIPTDQPNSIDMSKVSEWVRQQFGGVMPDKVVNVKVIAAGETKSMNLYVSGNKVVRLSEDNNKTTAKNITRHEAYAASMDKTLKDLKLVVDPASMSAQELSVVNGNVVTQHSEVAKAREEADAKVPFKTIRFEDGVIAKRAPARDVVDFYSTHGGRHGNGYNPGVAGVPSGPVYELQRDGETFAMFSIQGRTVGNVLAHNKVSKKQPSKLTSGRVLPNQQTSNAAIMPYVRAISAKMQHALQEFDVPPAKPGGLPHRLLKFLSRQTAPVARSVAWRGAGASPAGMSGWESTGTVPADRRLSDAGFIDMEKDGRKYQISITERGKKALAALNLTSKVALTPSRSSAKLADDQDTEVKKKVEPAAAPAARPATPAPAAAAPRAADAGGGGAGSKAERAQRLWDADVAATGVPGRAAFIAKLVAQVGMTPAGAATYYYNIKKKHAERGAAGAAPANESFTFIDYLLLG